MEIVKREDLFWVSPCEMGQIWCKCVCYSVSAVVRMGRIMKKWLPNPVVNFLLRVCADSLRIGAAQAHCCFSWCYRPHSLGGSGCQIILKQEKEMFLFPINLIWKSFWGPVPTCKYTFVTPFQVGSCLSLNQSLSSQYRVNRKANTKCFAEVAGIPSFSCLRILQYWFKGNVGKIPWVVERKGEWSWPKYRMTFCVTGGTDCMVLPACSITPTSWNV